MFNYVYILLFRGNAGDFKDSLCWSASILLWTIPLRSTFPDMAHSCIKKSNYYNTRPSTCAQYIIEVLQRYHYREGHKMTTEL